MMKRLALLLTLLTGAAAAQTTLTLASGGIGVSCNAITASTSNNPGTAGGCTAFALLTSGSSLPTTFTWQVITTGTPASVTVNFMGSIDGTTWTQLDTTSAAATRSVGPVAYRFVGCVPATLTGGSSPTVTCSISAGGGSSSGSGGALPFAGVPTGSCTSTQTAVNTTNGNLYTCSGGVWTAVGGTAGAVTNAIVQSGMIAQYAFTDNAGATLTDSSGSGNNGTLCAAGAAPAWVGAPSGGLTFTAASSQCVTLPAALNSAATVQIFGNFQYNTLAGSPTFECFLVGNGTKANTAALCQVDSNQNPGLGNTGTFGAANLDPIKGAAASTTGLGTTIGTGLTTWVLDATTDTIWTNLNQWPLSNAIGSAGQQTAGTYQLGGIASGYINGNSSFWSGTMYYALFYNRKLTNAEIAQNYNAINLIMSNRTVVPQLGSTLATKNIYVVDGDSLPGANGAWLQFAFPGATDGTWQAFYTGKAGWGVVDLQTNGNVRDDPYCPVALGSGNCILNIQIGTNNLGNAMSTWLPQYAQVIAQRRATGKYTQIWINTIIDKTAQSANKNIMNTAILQSWQSLGATGIIPIGEDPNLGCDGCNTNAFFNIDHLHPSGLGQYEIAHIQQPNINRATNGNFNFSSANTYTTTAATATTITAATESTNTVTITSAGTPASIVPGVDVTIAGVTPAGYNTSAGNVCHVLTAGGTTFTCLNSATGLGAGSVFGTFSTPMQLDIDAYVILAGSATTPNFTLQPCGSWVGGSNVSGWDGRVRIKNANTTSPWTVTPFAAETIDGAASITMPTASSGNNPVVILEAQALAASTGGCQWRRIQ